MICRTCPRTVLHRATYCPSCREAAQRATWRRLKQEGREADLTPQQIGAKLAAFDQERNRTRWRSGRTA